MVMSNKPITTSRSTTRPSTIRPKAGEWHNESNDDFGMFGFGSVVGAVWPVLVETPRPFHMVGRHYGHLGVWAACDDDGEVAGSPYPRRRHDQLPTGRS